MDNKVIFIDVDGTLVDYKGKLPTSARDAIRKARENGHKVFICTGRSEAEIYDNIWEIGLDGIIGGNGSYVKVGDEIIFWKHLSKQECTDIVNWLNDRNLDFYIEANSGLYASPNFRVNALSTIREYAGQKGDNPESITVEEAFPEMIFDDQNLNKSDANKISFILRSYQDHLDSKEQFPELKAGTWGGKGEKALFGDLSATGFDKGSAIDMILDHLDSSIDNTIAFGDATVDIPMLEKCSVGVAMGNGSDSVKEKANIFSDPVEEDGLYNAFEKLNLI